MVGLTEVALRPFSRFTSTLFYVLRRVFLRSFVLGFGFDRARVRDGAMKLDGRGSSKVSTVFNFVCFRARWANLGLIQFRIPTNIAPASSVKNARRTRSARSVPVDYKLAGRPSFEFLISRGNIFYAAPTRDQRA